MYRYWCFICCFFFAISVKAQHDPSDLIVSKEWDIIGLAKTQSAKNGAKVNVFPTGIKRRENTAIVLEGYMIPIRVGQNQSEFMLSSLPINQCFYCGQNGVPMMVKVEMAAPTTLSNNIVKIKGTLQLNTGQSTTPIVLKNAIKADD